MRRRGGTILEVQEGKFYTETLEIDAVRPVPRYGYTPYYGYSIPGPSNWLESARKYCQLRLEAVKSFDHTAGAAGISHRDKFHRFMPTISMGTPLAGRIVIHPVLRNRLTHT